MLRFFHNCPNLLVVTVIVTLFSSCSKPSITLTSDSILELSGNASSVRVSFSSTNDWKATPSDSWIRVSPTSGVAGTASITVSVADNDPNNGTRIGLVVIETEGASESITIKQGQKNTIESDNNYSVEPNGGDLSIVISHNVDLTVSVEKSAENWVKFIKTRGMTSTYYDFIVEPNNSTNDRVALITFAGEDVSKTIAIKQKGEYIDISPKSFSFKPDESKSSIIIISSCPWTLQSQESWIQLSTMSGEKGETEVVITTLENNENNVRTGMVQVFNSSLSINHSINVTQQSYTWYIDENGVNQGKGINIDGKIWAPVNCGYDETTAPRGLYYQWGRKFGQYMDYQVADIWQGENGEEDKNTVYRYGKDDENSGAKFQHDWIKNGSNTFWNEGSEDSPRKNEAYDPCPKGWRVPTFKELSSLSQHSFYRSGEHGTWFSGSKEYSDDLTSVLFLPAAGHRTGYWNCALETTGAYGFYWSSTVNKETGYSITDGSAKYLYFKSTTWGYSYSVPYRHNAQSVRCVHE